MSGGCSGIPFFTVLMTVYRVIQRQATRSLHCHLKLASTNKLSAVIEKLEGKSMKKTLVGSNVIYLLDWIDNLSNLQCEGVHSDITKEDAERCILQTYMCLGDILTSQ